MQGARRRILVWRFTIAFTGVGSTLLGPFLPSLLRTWQIDDREAGMLVTALFLGSFAGTLSMSDHLDGCLRRGSWAACAGCFGFAIAVRYSHGFSSGLAALLLMGFGMGQLMSSINLLVGAEVSDRRARQLAILGAAWCAGAILSPSVSSVLFPSITPTLRVIVLALLFLLPLTALPMEQVASQSAEPRTVSVSGGTLLCILMFLVYGGIEASISFWTPVFATRYTAGPLAASQWVISLFWCGLIVGRVVLAAFVVQRTELLMFLTATLTSLVCLACLASSSSFAQVAVGSALTGICLAPMFPLLLSAALARNHSNRTMGIMLACCALGSALLPFLLGIVSKAFSLRTGILLPIMGLFFLTVSRWSLRTQRQIAL